MVLLGGETANRKWVIHEISKSSNENKGVVGLRIHNLRSGCVLLVALGVVVNAAATVRELASGSWIPGRVSKNAVILAILLALAGILMAEYLLFIHS